MNVLGKYITTDSDFDPQPMFLVRLQDLSQELQDRIVQAVEYKEEYFTIQHTDYDELNNSNIFNLSIFPFVVDAYINFITA